MATEVILRIMLDGDSRDHLDWIECHGRTVQILDIVVGSERRKGRGRALIQKLLQQVPPDAAHVFAITRLSNTIAHEFYEACGFRLVGRLHYFYRDSDDVLEHALVWGLDR